MAKLYVIATPIGNLKDISLRALEILKEVDLILCEDTRVTKKLLDRFQISKPVLSYHQHSQLKRVDYILQLLKEGKNLSLVSDAGTPGISDPGSQLVFRITEAGLPNVEIVPIPGSSALAAAASVSGFPMDRFVFLGFPPHKRKRKKFFEEAVRHLADSKYPVIFYESPHRIIKTLNEINELSPALKLVVCRELTKKFETVYRGTVGEVLERLKKEKILGEFVVVLGNLKGAQ